MYPYHIKIRIKAAMLRSLKPVNETSKEILSKRSD
jgi:hypothetical protein